MNEKKRIVKLLVANGYLQSDSTDDYTSYVKSGPFATIDVGIDIVFLDDDGDFKTIPLNYYHLLGVMIQLKLLGLDCKLIQKEGG